MKHIISLIVSISLLFPYTALSYSYNVENWEVEAENIQNIKNTNGQVTLVNGGVTIWEQVIANATPIPGGGLSPWAALFFVVMAVGPLFLGDDNKQVELEPSVIAQLLDGLERKACKPATVNMSFDELGNVLDCLDADLDFMLIMWHRLKVAKKIAPAPDIDDKIKQMAKEAHAINIDYIKNNGLTEYVDLTNKKSEYIMGIVQLMHKDLIQQIKARIERVKLIENIPAGVKTKSH